MNICDFLDEAIYNSVILSSVRCNLLKYPPNAVLELEGFHGLYDEKKLVTSLKNAAAMGGTVLVVEKVGKSSR